MDLVNKYCEICGKRQATECHHLIGGTSERKLSDDYGLTLDVCRDCHKDIHTNNTANKLSKMLGQAMYERTRTHYEYMQRFKKNFLP